MSPVSLIAEMNRVGGCNVIREFHFGPIHLPFRFPLHLNALKRTDGSYLYVSPSQSEFRYLLVDREARGREIVIDGESFPETGTIRLDAVEAMNSRSPVSRPFSLPVELISRKHVFSSISISCRKLATEYIL